MIRRPNKHRTKIMLKSSPISKINWKCQIYSNILKSAQVVSPPLSNTNNHKNLTNESPKFSITRLVFNIAMQIKLPKLLSLLLPLWYLNAWKQLGEKPQVSNATSTNWQPAQAENTDQVSKSHHQAMAYGLRLKDTCRDWELWAQGLPNNCLRLLSTRHSRCTKNRLQRRHWLL